jgi:F0F1-type ATP synthase delta subunit
LKFDSEIHSKLKINIIKHDCKSHRDWSNFISNQKKQGKLHVVPIQLRDYIEVCRKLEEWLDNQVMKSKELSSEELSSKDIGDY